MVDRTEQSQSEDKQPSLRKRMDALEDGIRRLEAEVERRTVLNPLEDEAQ